MTNRDNNCIIHSGIVDFFKKEVKGISIFGKLFGNTKKKEAAVFVDYEHWHVSLYKKYSMRPQIKQWRDSIARDYTIADIHFFGDFSNPGMKYEIPLIREVTNNVIETQNTSPFHKKDFTDFIMLDYIYQSAVKKGSPDTYIIFTGDGHFASVVKFLVNVCKKHVIVYAVRDGLSGMLKSAASVCIELPLEEDVKKYRYSLISDYIDEIFESSNHRVYPTFVPVVDGVCQKYKLEKPLVKSTLEEMISLGYVVQRFKPLYNGRRIKYLYTDKNKLISDEIISGPN